jgi:hypothetical protein
MLELGVFGLTQWMVLEHEAHGLELGVTGIWMLELGVFGLTQRTVLEHEAHGLALVVTEVYRGP